MFRRGLLAGLATVLGGAIVAGLGGLGALFARATSRWPTRTARKWAVLCKLSDVQDGTPLETSFAFDRVEGWYRERIKRLVYVTKDSQGAPVVFSRTCTHLGCPVKWKAQSKTFACACHGGVFAADGSVAKAPPDRPLVRLSCRMAGELVEVEET